MIGFRMAAPTRISLLFVVGLFAASCGDSEVEGPSTPGAEAATIVSFEVTASILEEPGQVTLHWETSNATSISILQDDEAIELLDASPDAGSIQVSVERTTTFELIATGEVGEPARERRTVEVAASLEPPQIGSFEAPAEVAADETGVAVVQLSWSGVVGADSLRIESDTLETIQLGASQQPSGSESVQLSVGTTLFRLVATNPSGVTEAQAEVRVIPYPVIESFSPDRYRIGSGEDVEVSWATSGVEHVELWINDELEEDFDNELVSGSWPVTLLTDSTIELRAFNGAGGELRRSLEIEVGAPLLTISGNSNTFWLGESLLLEWESQGGTSVKVTSLELDEVICESTEREEIDAGSCSWEPPFGDHQVVVAVENSSGVTSEIWQLTVGLGPSITSFSAGPAALNLGDSVFVAWAALPDPFGNDPTLTLRDEHDNVYVLEELEGTLFITPEAPGVYTYTLEAATDHPLSTAAIATSDPITVHGLPSVTFSASAGLIEDVEEPLILSWTSEHVSSLAIYRVGVAEVEDPEDPDQVVEVEELHEVYEVPEADFAAGSFEVENFVSDLSYRIVAKNPLDAVAYKELEVKILPSGMISLSVDSEHATAGQPVKLTWKTRNADEVSFNFAEAGYIAGETSEPYIDAKALGGTFLPLDGCGPYPPAFFQTACTELSFPEGFRFPFGGEERSRVLVYNLGFLSFDTGAPVTSVPFGTAFPLPTAPHVHIAAYLGLTLWDATYPRGDVHYLLQEDASKGKSLIIQWPNVIMDPTYFGVTSARMNFEIVLWENGDFEYRFGEMDPGPNATQNHLDNVRAQASPLGYQLPGGAGAYNLDHGEGDFGVIENRSFIFKATAGFEPSGTMDWYPIASRAEIPATLTATFGSDEITYTQSVSVGMEPSLELIRGPVPTTPIQEGEPFYMSWKTTSAVSLEVLNENDEVICAAADEIEVQHGICAIYETTEGIYTYLLRATAASGATVERVVQTRVLSTLSIDRFEASTLDLNAGDSLTLSWETSNAASLSLTANGHEVSLPPGYDPAAGSLTLLSLNADTTFKLEARSPLGSLIEAELFVRHWNVGLELEQSATVVRPGAPVSIQIDARDLNDGPAPTVYGGFPLIEVTSPGPFVDISEDPEATSHTFHNDDDGGSVEVELPDFEFPYFGARYSKALLMADGYISFDLGATSNPNNQQMPGSAASVHLAPLWDDLKRGDGSLWTLAPDADSFVIQWKGWSKIVGSSMDEYDLNFQLVLFRDGSFEYRYGAMNPPAPPAVDPACAPESCENEANGSAATIGYQAPGIPAGYTLHFGGEDGPVDGGLANKAFRYTPMVGSGVLEVRPTQDETYYFCVEDARGPTCKSVHVETPFGISSFTIDSNDLDLGQSSVLRWKTYGGTRIRLLGTTGDPILDETNPNIIDNSAMFVTPTRGGSFVLELSAPGNFQSRVVDVDVVRAEISLSGPTQSTPGAPVSISWNLELGDPAMEPIIIKPMEEQSASFDELDISEDPAAIEIWGADVDEGRKELVFEEDFSFDFLGTEMRSVDVAVDGYLSFNIGVEPSTPGWNQPLPGPREIYRNMHIAPFWDDIHTRSQGRILAKRVNADTYVVQWDSVSLTLGSTHSANEFSLNFMAVLHRSGDFEFRYGRMDPTRFDAPSPSECYPLNCEREANGSAATIGFQDRSGTIGFMVHYGGRRDPSPDNVAMPGGLSDRSWRFTRTSATSGSVEVTPIAPTSYNICAFDPEANELYCPDWPIHIDIPWGIAAFDVNPWDPYLGDDVTLSWDVISLDELRLTRNDVPVFNYMDGEIPETGTLVETITGTTTYVLEGVSRGRIVRVERQIEPRTFDLDITVAPGRYFPGDTVEVSWSFTTESTSPAFLDTPMFEVPAGPGDPSEFVSIAGVGGASQLERVGGTGNGRYELQLPFPFPYFGESFEAANAIVDGYITFDPAGNTGVGANTALPNGLSNNRSVHLAAFWDDLVVRTPSEIWTHSPDTDTFIVEWKSFSRQQGSNNTGFHDINFQIVLFRDGAFEYRYGPLDRDTGVEHNSCYPRSCELEVKGSSATIGYQNQFGVFGKMLHFGGNGASTVRPFPGGLEGRAFRFEPQLSGTDRLVVERSGDYTICGTVDGFFECKAVHISTVADPGDLIISEMMMIPSGGQSEQWFELRNLRNDPIDLEGFEIRNARGTFTIGSGVVIPPLGYLVFAATSVPGYAPDVVYGDALRFNTGIDSLEVWAGPTRITGASWGEGLYLPIGRTLYTDPSEHLRGKASPSVNRWCEGSQRGSPGVTAEGCYSAYYDVDPNGQGGMIDISTVGTQVHAFETNDHVEQLIVGNFSWEPFGTEVNTIWAGGNGWLSFSATDPGGGSAPAPSAGQLPRPGSAVPAGPVLGVYWDFLRCNPSDYECAFRYFYGDVGGEAVFVAEWRGFRRGSAGGINVQAQLYPSGDFKVVIGDAYYGGVPGSETLYEYRSNLPTYEQNAQFYRGQSAWIGLENEARTEYVSGLHRTENHHLNGRVFHFKAK